MVKRTISDLDDLDSSRMFMRPGSPEAVEYDRTHLNSSFRLRSGYDGREKEFSDATAYVEDMPTLAQQQFKDDNNPNVVMATFARSRDMSDFYKGQPKYGDFTGSNDLFTSLNIVHAAEDAFFSLPARIRTRFDNDPLLFAQFLDDKSNFAEAKELGLLRPDAKSMRDGPPLEDLSTPSGASPGTKAPEGVVKSTSSVKASPSSSNAD